MIINARVNSTFHVKGYRVSFTTGNLSNTAILCVRREATKREASVGYAKIVDRLRLVLMLSVLS